VLRVLAAEEPDCCSMTLHYSEMRDAARIDVAIASSRSFEQKGLYRTKVKRILDVALILMASIIVVPVVMILACLVALDGQSPFYSQQRVGKNGKTFRLWKIRTMTVGAEDLLEEYLGQNPEAAREWHLHQKLKHDPRVTKIGRILRKTSVDELPQLWNVLTGSMSLVGPRPMMPSQQGDYFGSAYYRLLPGITGLWQISDRNDCSFAARAVFDEQYDKTVSFSTDLRTLFRTVSVVLRGTGY